MIRVLFFAQLREDLGCAEFSLENSNIESVSDVSRILLEKNPHWQPFLTRQNLRVAVNQAYAKMNTTVSQGDEVAFFPPVTGG